MTFEWLNKQGVKSDKGFVVQVVSRFTIEYREENQKILVDVENDIKPNGNVCVIIKRDSFKSWESGKRLDQHKQNNVIDNFKSALEFQGLEVILEP